MKSATPSNRRSLPLVLFTSGTLAILLPSACCEPSPSPPIVPSTTTASKTAAPEVPTLDEAESSILLRHAITDAALDDVRSAALDTISAAATATAPLGGYNIPRTSRLAVHVYVVDAKMTQIDTDACGPTGDAGDVPVKQRDICIRLSSFRDNCAVLAPRTIACDFRLVWRLSRSAAVIAISSLKKPGLDEYYFPRAQLRETFLAGEAKYDTTEKQLDNLRTTNESFAGKFIDVQETRVRVLRGFVAFLLSHEMGHIALGHVVWNALPACAIAVGAISPNSRICAPPHPNEEAADDFACNVLAKDLSPGAFTPARAAPEFFVEEYERRQRQALLDIGQDPKTWNYKDAANDLRTQFEAAWLRRISTGSHPKDLRRYVILLKLLESRKIQLTESKEKMAIAEAELAMITRMCSQPPK